MESKGVERGKPGWLTWGQQPKLRPEEVVSVLYPLRSHQCRHDFEFGLKSLGQSQLLVLFFLSEAGLYTAYRIIILMTIFSIS